MKKYNYVRFCLKMCYVTQLSVAIVMIAHHKLNVQAASHTYCVLGCVMTVCADARAGLNVCVVMAMLLINIY